MHFPFFPPISKKTFMSILLTRICRMSLVALMSGSLACTAAESSSGTAAAPALYGYPASAIAYAKARVQAQDPGVQSALARLKREADKALTQPMPSVMDKKILSVSGDPHDYFSFGLYWWPNPKSKDGLPYIQRDGERNPDAMNGDSANIGIVASTTLTLGLAYYFTGNEAYAQNAAERLHIWFLDPATKMNPHLQYAQAIPGITDGRKVGLIDTVRFIRLLDGVQLLASSPHWTPEMDQGIKQWFNDYLDWLLTSSHGLEEARAKNNHGTYYDAQISAFALFVGRNDLARQVTTDALKKRLAAQVRPDGQQPEEMRRTTSLNYSVYNTNAFLYLAREAALSGGQNWWKYRAPNGATLQKAVGFLGPYWNENAQWVKKDIRYPSRSGIRDLLVRAAALSNDPELLAQIKQFSQNSAFQSERWHLYLPVPSNP